MPSSGDASQPGVQSLHELTAAGGHQEAQNNYTKKKEKEKISSEIESSRKNVKLNLSGGLWSVWSGKGLRSGRPKVTVEEERPKQKGPRKSTQASGGHSTCSQLYNPQAALPMDSVLQSGTLS